MLSDIEMLQRMGALDPAPIFMGGWAEDALLAGTKTRPHGDFDWPLPRSELPLRRAQAVELGFAGFETWGEAAPGEPFYVYSESADHKLELGVLDEEDGGLWMKVHRIMFEIGGKEAPAGYRVRLPDDTLAHPPAGIDGIELRVASPLCLLQMRTSIAAQGSFGEPSERHQTAARALRERFFPNRSDAELEPEVRPLS